MFGLGGENAAIDCLRRTSEGVPQRIFQALLKLLWVTYPGLIPGPTSWLTPAGSAFVSLGNGNHGDRVEQGPLIKSSY